METEKTVITITRVDAEHFKLTVDDSLGHTVSLNTFTSIGLIRQLVSIVEGL